MFFFVYNSIGTGAGGEIITLHDWHWKHWSKSKLFRKLENCAKVYLY